MSTHSWNSLVPLVQSPHYKPWLSRSGVYVSTRASRASQKCAFFASDLADRADSADNQLNIHSQRRHRKSWEGPGAQEQRGKRANAQTECSFPQVGNKCHRNSGKVAKWLKEWEAYDVKRHPSRVAAGRAHMCELKKRWQTNRVGGGWGFLSCRTVTFNIYKGCDLESCMR